MEYKTYRFDQLNTSLLYAILALREKVFIVEQNAIYDDIDGLDKQALHICLMDGDTLAGYTRLIPPAVKFEEASIGRIVLAPEYRGGGRGRELVRRSMEEMLKHFGPVPIRIEAQVHLRGFYESLGFGVVSEAYDWGGIDHVKMVTVLAA
ncbi:MAG: GNAT family N-acetyltransferase [Proteobacteria bacterium]|nr:GNAT family N-acetyltransferase [Pseudomonadota bacterium]